MKKIMLALLIVAVALTVASQAMGKIALGIDTAAGNLGIVNAPAFVVRYDMTDSITGRLGLNYNSYKTQAGVTTSQTGLSLRVDYFIPKTFGAAKPLVGLQYATDGATTATSTISLLLGVEAEVADGVYAGAGLIPYSTATTNSNSDTAMVTGSANGSARGAFISMGFYL